MMRVAPLPPVSTLRELLNYDPDTGVLTWRDRAHEWFSSRNSAVLWNGRYAGTPALHHKTAAGYRYGKVLGSSFMAHRIAWAIATGEAPEFIDHINGDRSDNRLENLRSVSWEENARNRQRPSNNASGAIGVHWCNTNRKWVAQIKKPGSAHQNQIGWFENKADAIACRKAAERELGFHRNHGREAVPA